MPRKKTTEQFIKEAIVIHGDKYDYSKVEYGGTHEKVCIICPIHGEFWQTPDSHLQGKGCQKCHHDNTRLCKTISKDEIIKKIVELSLPLHFSFEDFCDKNGKEIRDFISVTKSYIKLKCNYCGRITIVTYNNLKKRKNGCSRCAGLKNYHKTKDEIVKIINRYCKTHDFVFNGFDGEYKNNRTIVNLTCKKCGYHYSPSAASVINHEYNCPKCSRNAKLNEQEVITRVTARCIEENYTFLGFYDKNRVQTKFNGIKNILLGVKCNNCNNKYFINYNNFINKKQHCRTCNIKILEKNIFDTLNKNSVVFIHDHETKHTLQWLDNLRLDFYLPEYNIAIECQGIQHFKPIDYFGGETAFEKQQKNDEKKRKLCEENGIKLLYYSNLGIEYPYKVYEDINELIKEIRD